MSAAGTLTATLDWADAVVNLDLYLYSPSGALVAQASSLTARPESLSYAVPAGATGTYTLVVANESPVGTTYSVSGAYPVYADLNLELLDPSGAKVAEAAASGPARPEALTYTVAATATGTYTLKVVAATDSASYTLTYSYPVTNERTYSYDARGRPAGEETSLASATSSLDGLGRVIRRTERDWKGATTRDVRYVFEDGQDSPVAEADPATGAVTTSYLEDPDGLLAARSGGVTRYQYFTGHGDLAQVVDQTGTATHSGPLAYDEFGAPQGTAATPYGFTGRWQRETSAVTPTVRMGARLYDPALGRFLSRDPIEGGDLNAYLHAGADPVNNYDLNGTHCSGPRYKTYRWTGEKWKRLHDHWYCGVGRGFKRFFVGFVAVLAGGATTLGGLLCAGAQLREGPAGTLSAWGHCGPIIWFGVSTAVGGVIIWARGLPQDPHGTYICTSPSARRRPQCRKS